MLGLDHDIGDSVARNIIRSGNLFVTVQPPIKGHDGVNYAVSTN